MSHVAPGGVTTSTSSEKNAMPPTPSSSSSRPKVRSCVVCRTRKVRCDKQSPCSNCRRANIACVLPSTDHPPRWARRLLPSQASQDPNHASPKVVERLRYLEDLVKELRSQLEPGNIAPSLPAGGTSTGVNSPESSNHDRDTDTSSNTNTANVPNQIGRLVLHGANQSSSQRYVSSGFWSRVNDELEGLNIDNSLRAGDSDTSEDKDEASPRQPLSTQELERMPADRHAFLFRHNLNPSSSNLREFHPLPSQIPFLLDVFSENINYIVQIIHVPTITKMVRDCRGGYMTSLTPANEALMFSIYYAAITSMEEDDVMTNFGFTKTDLNLKYRLGLEHALANADFLNVPDLVLVQAFSIFLLLVRRHDSPRFVWMMTGLAIRMGQALGLHRDGAYLKHLTPYEIEMRRRVWWGLCMLDTRASEDQGMDYTIAHGSFDTKLPLNINDADIDPATTQMPAERKGITDMSIPLVWLEIGELARQMTVQKESKSSIEEQSHLLNEMYQKLDRRYLQYSSESGNITYWVTVVVARLVMAKMTLLIYLPILFSSPNEQFSSKDNLLIAAIETAEYNHALNAEPACRRWRWVYQTYTHWYAIVYLLIETSRRPWSPTVERAWVALHSPWLIPSQSRISKHLRVWIPLRKLMAKARKHRDTELERLRSNSHAAEQLEMEDQRIPVPGSPGPFPAPSNVVELFRERWRQLLVTPEKHGQSGQEVANPSTRPIYTPQPIASSMPTHNMSGSELNTNFEPAYLSANTDQTSQNLPSNTSLDFQSTTMADAPDNVSMSQTAGVSHNDASAFGPELAHWPWADIDPSVDVFANVDMDAIDVDIYLDGEVDWYTWVDSARGMEFGAMP